MSMYKVGQMISYVYGNTTLWGTVVEHIANGEYEYIATVGKTNNTMAINNKNIIGIRI